MTDDDRLSRHLAASASAIILTPADPAGAVRRGTRRRNRRRAALGGVVAVALAATTFSAFDRQPAPADSDLAAAGVVATPFDWTVVEPEAGLGYSRSATLADGSIYSLSSAPGPYDERSSFEPHLYRSTDGAEWAQVTLPGDMRASSIAANEGSLYAVGTAPAGGGGRDLVLSTSDDGAASWSSITLPDDVAALEGRHPGEITISQPDVAAADDAHLVATVVVTATPNVDALLPGPVDPAAGWETTAEGVTVYEMVPCEDVASEHCSEVSASPSTTVRPGDDEGPRNDALQPMEPKVAATYTWDELGLDPELRELIGGRTYVYASDDGTTFERAALPDGRAGWGGGLIAVDDGYRLYLAQSTRDSSTTSVLRSADGHTWTESAVLDGAPQAAGLLAGRPAVGLFGSTGGLQVRVEEPDGTYTTLDLLAAVEGADESSGVGDVAFGPLGVAAMVWTGEAGTAHVVHSLDGKSISAVALADHIPGTCCAMGVAVTADAILVRVNNPPDGDSATPPTQRVLVGTPR